MRKLFIGIVFVCFLLNCQAQKTKVYIVGTVHQKTKYINPDTLENLLVKIKPDVVLSELDSSFFDNSFHFDLKKYPDLLSTNENISIYNYSKKYPNVKIRPFDITGRNEFYSKSDYFNKEQSMFNDFIEMKNNNQFSEDNKCLFDVTLNILQQYASAEASSLKEVNSNLRDRFTELKYNYYDVFIHLAESEPQLNKWSSFIQLQKSFWDERNKTMAKNIFQIAKQNENKTLIVFVGFEHRYYLINILKGNTDIQLVKDGFL